MNWTQAEHAKSSTRALIRIEILTPRAMEAESLGQNVRVFKNHGLIPLLSLWSFKLPGRLRCSLRISGTSFMRVESTSDGSRNDGLKIHWTWTGNTENGLPASDKQFLVTVKKTRCRMKIEAGCPHLWEILHYQKRENLLLMPLRFLASRDHHLSAWRVSLKTTLAELMQQLAISCMFVENLKQY
ncbi:unnamed protein product, partial [Vitis vinifera]